MTNIDIILPYYNGHRFIKEQLDSILVSDLEGINPHFIIINDKSTLESTEFIKEILPPNTTYIENKENLGVIKSIELGLNISKANYIMLCDQDDVWLPQKIIKSFKHIQENENNGPCLVYTDLKVVDENLQEIHPSMARLHGYHKQREKISLIFRNIVTGCTVIINRKALEKALPFPNNIPMHDHWLAVITGYTGKVLFLDEPLILYRQHGKNQVGSNKEHLLKKLSRIHKILFSRFQMLKAVVLRD